MKRRLSDLTELETIHTLDTLYTAAAAVKGRAAMKLFLRDLLTPSERIMLGRRIMIARMLLAGISDEEISERLKVARSTIWRIQKWLQDQFPGFESAIRDMEKEFDSRKGERMTNLSMCSKLKRKYPLHFLFFK
jgi:uncharacterized protein YerC